MVYLVEIFANSMGTRGKDGQVDLNSTKIVKLNAMCTHYVYIVVGLLLRAQTLELTNLPRFYRL